MDLGTGEDGWVPADQLELSYRHSSLASTQVVTTAELRLATGDRTRSEAEIADIVRWRRENQPGGANAGSVFTNPPGDSAGRLIEQSGAKGLRVGTAEVSTKHANFIQADDGGRADDVVALMGEVERRVAEATGVRLVPETRLVGFDLTLDHPSRVREPGADDPAAARTGVGPPTGRPEDPGSPRPGRTGGRRPSAAAADRGGHRRHPGRRRLVRHPQPVARRRPPRGHRVAPRPGRPGRRCGRHPPGPAPGRRRRGGRRPPPAAPCPGSPTPRSRSGWNGTAHLSVTERVPAVAVAAGPGRWMLTDAKGKVVAPVTAVPPGVIAVTGVAPVAAGASFGPALGGPARAGRPSDAGAAHPGRQRRRRHRWRHRHDAEPQRGGAAVPADLLAEKLSSLTTFFARVDDRGLGVVNACIPDAIYVSGRTS